MSLSLYEKFLGYDWERYSGLASRGTCLSSAVVGVVSVLLVHNFLLGFLSIFIALVMALWEFPWIFYCIPKSDQALTLLNEKIYLQTYEAKAVICAVLSILTYLHSSIVIITGILLDITALLFIFAMINKRQDRADGLVDVEQPRPYEQKKPPKFVSSTLATASATQSLLQASGKFGTF